MPQTIEQLTPNLWLAQSEVYTTNSGVFFANGKACLVDPAVLPEDILTLRRTLSEQKLEPQYLVITHHHWDHLFGPEYFQDVRVITQAGFSKELCGCGAEQTLGQIQRFEKEYSIRRSRQFRLPTADITFEHSLSIRMDELTVEIIHAPGHSPDQCVLYQPEEGILWAADMLSDLEIPFIMHDLDAYQQTLAELRKLEVRLLVPGHGHFAREKETIQGRFKEDMDYLAELRQRLEKSTQAGKSLEEAFEDCKDMCFKHQEENANPHRDNVETVYKNLMNIE